MDRLALEAELARLHTDSFGWALRCCFDERETASEVLQTAYLKILEGKARYRGDSGFRTWLFSVIRFTAIDHFRRAKRKKSINIFHSRDDQTGAEAALIAGETTEQRMELLLRGLRQLSPQQRQVLHLVFYQQCTIQEAAEVMEIRLGTARTHYQRGKQQLRQWLIESGALKDTY